MNKIKPNQYIADAYRNAPTDEWECSECGSKNNNWCPDMLKLLRKDPEISYSEGFCKNCDDIKTAKEQETRKKERLDKERKRSERLIKTSEMPENLKKIYFDNIELKEGARNAFASMRYIEKAFDKKTWIYLFGDNNTGKSTLVGACMNMLIKKKIPCFYLNESLFFNRLKATFKDNTGESIEYIISLIKEAKVLFWDDFLHYDYTKNDWRHDILYQILEYMGENNKVIVFTSNVDPEINKRENGTLWYKGLQVLAGNKNVARLARNSLCCIKMENEKFF